MEQTKQKTDVYQLVTNRMIELLEKGIIPWRKEWLGISTPRNLVTGNPYRGINFLLLTASGYSDNYFLTFKQVQELHGKVRKGERSQPVVYWNWRDKVNEDTGEVEKKAYLRYYLVFNVAQCEGIQTPSQKKQEAIDSIAACDRIIEEFEHCPQIRYSGKTPFYHTKEDYINMLPQEKFKHSDGFYASLFHELVHSTGHESRLARTEIVNHIDFGSEAYAREELTAEMGACFLKYMTDLQDDTFENSAAYIQSWLKKLKGDKRMVVYAAAHAQKAVDYILNVQPILTTHWSEDITPTPHEQV